MRSGLQQGMIAMQDTFLIIIAMSSPEKVAILGACPSLIHGYGHGTDNLQPFVCREQLLSQLVPPREKRRWCVSEHFGVIVMILRVYHGIGHACVLLQ